MATANTTHDIQEIKESLGQEVVPAVTGKPSRILKTKGKKTKAKQVTAGGVSLFEIAAAIQENPNLTPAAAIRQGQKEAKAQRTVEEGGKLTRGTKMFLKAALGNGLGGWLAGVLDTKQQRQEKKFDAIQRKYEEGNFLKANFLKGLLGEKLGGMLSKATTLTSTKVSAFQKYQELMKVNEAPQTAQKVAAPPSAVTPSMVPTLQPATPAAATRLTAPAANVEATKQLSEQDQAEKDKKEQEQKEKDKEDKEFKKEVKEELKKVEENTSKKGGLGWLLAALGAALAGLLYENWDKIMKALGNLKEAYNTTVDWTSRHIIEPIMDAIKWVGEKIQPVIDWFAKHFSIEAKAAHESIQQGVKGASGRGLGETLSKKAILAQAAEFHNKGNYAQEKMLIERASKMGDSDVWSPAQNKVVHSYEMPITPKTPPKQVAITPKAPPITAPQVGNVSQANQDIKKENAQEDFMSQFQQAMMGASMPNRLDIATAKDVKDIKAALPSLAKDSTPPSPIIKLGNDESSAAGYMGQIFDHPATWGAKP